MCYNCGCGIIDDDMGRGKLSEGGAGLTEEDLQKLAKEWGMSLDETKQNIYDLLKTQVKKK